MSSTNAHQSPHLPEDHPAGAHRFLPAGVGSPLVRENVRATPGNAGAGVAQTMEQLTLVGLSDGRDQLLLVDSAGARYTVDVDNALRSAVRGEQPRPGHLETRMDSALRPRDIQARIRAGETAEAVAAAAGSTVEKIMPYAAPVLAERAHVAERAQKSSVRRRPGETSHFPGARTLQEAVATQLRSQNTDPESVEWDAFRREDGRWSLTGLFETSDRTGVATFIFDVPGNYVTAEDVDARWLVGDVVEAPAAVVDETEGRRLSAVPSALGDDAIELVQSASDTSTVDPTPVSPQPTPAASVAPPVAPPLAEERTIDLTETVNRIRGTHVPAPQAPQPAAPEPAPEATAPVAPPAPAPVAAEPVAAEPVAAELVAAEPETKEAAPAEEAPAEEAAQAKTEEPEAEPAPQPAPKKTSKRRGRASVPSWDEIMFGGGGGE